VAPNWGQEFKLMCDASDYAVGPVLGQKRNERIHVIYYANKVLNRAQINCATTEKEMLLVVYALEKCRSYLGSKDHCAHQPFNYKISTRQSGFLAKIN